MSENRTTEIRRRQGPGVQSVFLYGDIMIAELEMVQDSELEHVRITKKQFTQSLGLGIVSFETIFKRKRMKVQTFTFSNLPHETGRKICTKE